MYNPWFVHADEIKWHGYEIINNLSEKNKKYDAILVNVCHKKFKAYTTNDYEQLSNGEKVIIDIKILSINQLGDCIEKLPESIW